MIDDPEFCVITVAQAHRTWRWHGVYAVVTDSLYIVFTRHHAPGDRPGHPTAVDHVASFPLVNVLWSTERVHRGDPYVVGNGRDPVDGTA